jgi:hypothetical protein
MTVNSTPAKKQKFIKEDNKHIAVIVNLNANTNERLQ